MSSRRVLKAAQAIREVVSMAILTDLKDPRVRDVTVTFVEVSGDMRFAKVHVSVMGDDGKKDLCLRGLQSSAGYLQSKVGKRIDTRYTPKIQFELDKGVEHSMVVTRILEEVLPKEPVIDDVDEEPDTNMSSLSATESMSGELATPTDPEPPHDSTL
jgi:ribosome-binding factor A